MNNSVFSIDIPAINVTQPIGDFFIGVISHKVLRDIAAADVRRLRDGENDVDNYLGIQRVLKASRVKEIENYVQTQTATFPTSIILAVDHKCATWDAGSRTLCLEEFLGSDTEEPIPKEKIANILDGQHRLAGLKNIHVTDFDIPIAIFIGADIAEQATIFATVNLAQTKVNKSLVYDLHDYSKYRSPAKSCHLITVALNNKKESPLFGRIKRLGVSTPGKKGETLTQATVVESLIKYITEDTVKDAEAVRRKRRIDDYEGKKKEKCFLRPYWIKEEELLISKAIYLFFSAVEDKWPKSWAEIDRPGNILPKTNGFRALIRFLRPVYLRLSQGGKNLNTITYEDYRSIFTPLDISEDIFTLAEFPHGTSGESKLYKLLLEKSNLPDL